MEKTAKCFICSFDAVMTCKPCQKYFCKKCVAQHLLTKSGNKHGIVPYIHVDNKLILPYCDSHNNQVCELKCRQCQTHICPMCVTTNHEEHTIDEIAILVEEKKEVIREEICEIEATLLQYGDTEIQVKENLLSTNENAGVLLSQMEEQSLELKRSVDDIVCGYKESVENAALENKGVLSKFLEKIEEKKESLRMTINKKTKLLDDNTAEFILGYQTNYIDKNIPPVLTFAPLGTFTPSDKSKEGFRDYLGKLSLTACSCYGNTLCVEGDLEENSLVADEVSAEKKLLIVDRHKYYEEEDKLIAVRLSDGNFGVVQRNKISPKQNDIPNHFQEWFLPIGISDAERILSPSSVDVGTFLISDECRTSYTLSIKMRHSEKGQFVDNITVSKLNDCGAVFIMRENVFPDLRSLIEFYQKSTMILREMPCKPSKIFPQPLPSKIYSGQQFQTGDLIIGEFCEDSSFYCLYSGTLKGHERVSINVFLTRNYEEINSADDVIQELEIMKSFSDEHILRLIGVVSQTLPLLMITEPVTGSLQRHLRNVTYLCENEIFIILEQIIKGMQYIHIQGFAHGCLCSESILLGKNKEVKIGRFHCTKYLEKDPFVIHENLSPLRWSPPELLRYKRFGTKSDVWAFGILLYEMFTLGSLPYVDLEDDEICLSLDNGFRLPKPRGMCSEHYYHIMQLCWSKEESRRPTFTELENKINHTSQPLDSEKVSGIAVQLQECWLPLGKEKAAELLLQEDVIPGTYLISETQDDNRSYTLSLKYIDASQRLDIAHIEVMKCSEKPILYNIPGDTCSNVRFRNISTLLKYHQDVEISPLYGRLKEPHKHKTSFIPFTGFEIDRTAIALHGTLQIRHCFDIYKGSLKSAKRYSIFIYKLPEEKSKTKSPFRQADDAVIEAINLCKFSNENILGIFGMCSTSSPIVMVTDFVDCTLLHYVRKCDDNFTSQEMNAVLTNITNGMIFLHRRKYSHRDLCASNVFLEDRGGRKIFKIGGLHFAEYLRFDPMEMGEVLPFQNRWCAPEILQRRQFGSKSDIWSFGVLIFEIVSKGQVPYKTLEDTEVKERVTNGYRIPRHRECTDFHHAIMELCWKEDLSSRPTFQSMKQILINQGSSKSFKRKEMLKFLST